MSDVRFRIYSVKDYFDILNQRGLFLLKEFMKKVAHLQTLIKLSHNFQI